MNKLNHQNTAFVLVGGFGTRLKELFPDTPKPLVTLGGEVFLTSLLKFLKAEGIKKAALLTGFKADDFERYVSSNPVDGIELSISQEDKPLGSAGAVGLAYQTEIKKKKSEIESVLVVNGDTWFEGQISELLTPIKSGYRVLLTHKDPAERYGLVDLNEKNEILKFKEKTAGSQGWVHSGFVVLSKDVLESLPADEFCSLEKDIYPNHKGSGVKSEGQFFDYGVPVDYFDLNRDRWLQNLDREDPKAALSLTEAFESILPIVINDKAYTISNAAFDLVTADTKFVDLALLKKDPNLLRHGSELLKNPTMKLSTSKSYEKRPAIFFDRDGTLIEHIHYLKDPNQVHVLDGAYEKLRAYQDAGWRIVIVTNQSGIGREYFSWETYKKVHAVLIDKFRRNGIEVDWTFAASYYEKSPRWHGRGHKLLRKPFPGIAKIAEQAFNLDLAESIMVGDSHVDAGFGVIAGLKKVYWINGNPNDLGKNPAELNVQDRVKNSKTEIQFISCIADLPLPKSI